MWTSICSQVIQCCAEEDKDSQKQTIIAIQYEYKELSALSPLGHLLSPCAKNIWLKNEWWMISKREEGEHHSHAGEEQ